MARCGLDNLGMPARYTFCSVNGAIDLWAPMVPVHRVCQMEGSEAAECRKGDLMPSRSSRI